MFKKICAYVLTLVFASGVLVSLGAVREARADWCMLGQDASDPNCIKWSNNSSNTGSTESGYSNSGYSQPTRTVIVDRFGAVAYDVKTGNYGYSEQKSSEHEAAKAAIEDCNNNNCTIVGSYKNQCIGYVEGYVKGGWITKIDFGKSKSTAEQNALSLCSKHAKSCRVLMSGCSIYGK
jgi:hypothetical protein